MYMYSVCSSCVGPAATAGRHTVSTGEAGRCAGGGAQTAAAQGSAGNVREALL